MSEHIHILLASVLIIGVLAQWLAWKLRFPSILLLLGFGLIAGSVTGFLDTDALLGDLLFPVVSFSVAIILYEGGLSLRLKDLKAVGGVVGNLVTVGVLVTWLLTSAAAYFLTGLNLQLSLLLGAVLSVTGPTVVQPLLQFVRPTEKVGTAIKWEGILVDPIGAMLAVIVFEQIISGGTGHGLIAPFLGVITTLVSGIIFGAAGAGIMYLFVKWDLIPDFLLNPISLGLVIAVQAGSNLVQHESGLLAVTIMGVVLANQQRVPIKHIVEFKENLRVLLISILFIILAARVRSEELLGFTWQDGIFVLLLIFIVRPAAVYLSTIRSSLNWRERAFAAWMAPRGIIAAAVVSIFSFSLIKAGMPGAERLVPLTFLVIISTVVIYGLTAKPVAVLLGVSEPDPQGVLFVGAHFWARSIAAELKKMNVRTLLVDSNQNNIKLCQAAGLAAVQGNILSDSLVEKIDMHGIGRVVALTPNEEVNSLVCLRFAETFGQREVYQLAPIPKREGTDANQMIAKELRGRTLFFKECTFSYFSRLYDTKAEIRTIKFKNGSNLDKLRENNGEFIPMFIVSHDRKVIPVSSDSHMQCHAEDSLVYLERGETTKIT